MIRKQQIINGHPKKINFDSLAYYFIQLWIC